MDQAIADSLQEILQRGNPLTKKVIADAVRISEKVEHLTTTHLFLSLCSEDPSLVFPTFKRSGVDMGWLLRALRNECVYDQTPDGINYVLKLVCETAPIGLPITTTHLLVSIVMEDTNQISHHVRERKVDVEALIRKRFSYMLARTSALRKPSQNPETRARAWLREVIPRQGLSYMLHGWIELRSKLNPRRLYRIHHENRGTEIFEDGILTANSCMHTVDPLIPPTDRVLAEYFLLKGDEVRYLSIANITPS
jgi:hypothetical protein